MTARRVFVVLFVTAFAILAAACDAPRREVLVIVTSTYPRSGSFAGVDRYQLTVWRRDRCTAQWTPIETSGTGVFVFGTSQADLTRAADGGVFDAGTVYRLPGSDEVGRHLLRAADPNDADEVLVVVQAGQAAGNAAFIPTGPPVAAQFTFPASRAQLELMLDVNCRNLVVAPTSTMAMAYVDCVTQNDRCPAMVSQCVAFVDGMAQPTPCADTVAFDAGASGCPAPGATCTDGTTSALVPIGSTAPCASGSGAMVCGANGAWSRCVPFSTCSPGGEPHEPCCENAWQFDPSMPSCGAGLAPLASCHGDGWSCDAVSNTCEPCGGDNAICCDGGVCLRGGRCDAATNRCLCGSVGQPCCSGGVCASDLACGSDGTCQSCGTVPNAPCCPGVDASTGAPIAYCAGGLACSTSGSTAGTCQQCGAANAPCCPSSDPRAPQGYCQTPLECNQAMVCVACGNAGEPCCNANACSANTTCLNGSCTPCGQTYQPCCNGICALNNNCNPTDQTCTPCGAFRQPCCDDPNTNTGPGTCPNPCSCFLTASSGWRCCGSSGCATNPGC